jgi:acyl-lipid omega-6 desaturase (Delta-12 desaturase)
MNEIPYPDFPDLRKNWRAIIAPYQQPEMRRSLWQIANTVLPYLALWALMAWTSHFAYWLTLILAVPAAGFMMRTFIIFHDCGHGSFFNDKRLNTWVGRVTGVLTFTAFYYWTHDHAIHHATAGDLDRRGVGDVETLTVKEYLALPGYRRLAYRMMRNPFFMLVIGAPLVFLVFHRLWAPGSAQRERSSVIWTDISLAAVFAVLVWALGFKTVVMVHLPILWLGTAGGVWLFYVQHQFEGVYWRRHSEWDYLDSALQGASYYKLPKILQWFSGNIGFHHLHHLSPRIPNYRLEACQKENPVFQAVQPLTLLTSLRSLRLRLYDEERRRLIGFRELKLQRT